MSTVRNLRPLDVVILGGTGYTGGLVLEHFLKHYADQKDIRWGFAGRNETKTKQALKTAAENVSVTDFPAPELIIADSTNKASLMALCKRTNVVLTTVGPYHLYGDLLVDCCVESDTDCCDLTGETFWTRKVIDKHHDTCVEKGTRIVNSTGFDSIPTDLGILLACEEALKKSPNDPVVSAIYNAGRIRGGMSGGSVASGIGMMKERKKGCEYMKMADEDPYALCPDMESKHRADDNYGFELAGNGPSALAPVWSKSLGCYLGTSLMGATNSAIVRRSMFLNKYKYGEHLKVEEVQMHKSLSSALTLNVGLVLSATLGKVNFLRNWAEKKLVSKPGEGLSRKEVEEGYLNGTAVIETKEGRKFVCKVHGERDPGYGCTSGMISETAVLLARTRVADRAGKGGVCTPASAAGLGLPLVDALKSKARMTFETKEVMSDEELVKTLFI